MADTLTETYQRIRQRLKVGTGHSDYQAMKPYIAIAEKTKADAMKLFDEELKE